MTSTPAAEVAQWAGLFDVLSSSYDQSGVPFFGTIAEGLVEQLEPQPGERALDIGAGRGALTFRLAAEVGSTGHVDAIDIAPGMVELTTEAVRELGLSQVEVRVDDATDPQASGPYDLIASSLVLFFLPEPDQALARWLPLLAPGGRLGVSTFRPWPETWQSIEDVFDEYVEDTGRPGPTQMPEVYADDSGVEHLFAEAGAVKVRTVGASLAIPFDDLEQWRSWSLGTAMRGLWLRTPEESHPEILTRVGEILERTRGDDGQMELDVDIRYTLGRREASAHSTS